jgi:hypothetical protein
MKAIELSYFIKEEKSLEVGIVHLNIEPKMPGSVSVIPIGVDLSPIEVPLLRTEKIKNYLEGGSFYWRLGLSSIQDTSFLNVPPVEEGREKYPFDVVVLYPAITRARIVPPVAEDLPEEFSLENVQASVDVTGDGRADALILEWCCDGEGFESARAIYEQGLDCIQCTLSMARTEAGWKRLHFAGGC